MVIIAAAAVQAAVKLRNRAKKREMREGIISSDGVLNEAGGGGSADGSNPSNSNWWRGDGGSYSANLSAHTAISSSIPSSASPAEISSCVQPGNAHGSPSTSSSMSSGSAPIASQEITLPSSAPSRAFALESASGSNSSEEEQKVSEKSDSAADTASSLPGVPGSRAIEVPAIPRLQPLGIPQSRGAGRKHSAPPGSFAATASASASASSSLPAPSSSSSASVSVSAPSHRSRSHTKTRRRRAVQPETGSFAAAMDNSSTNPNPKPKLYNSITASPITPEAVPKMTRSQPPTSMPGSFVSAMTTLDVKESAVGTDTPTPTETIAATFANSSMNKPEPGSVTAAAKQKLATASSDQAALPQGIGSNTVAVSRPRPRSNAHEGSFVSEMSKTLPPRLQGSAMAPIPATSADETSRTSTSISSMNQPSRSSVPESVSGSFSAALSARHASGTSLSGYASPQPVEGNAVASALPSRRAKRRTAPAQGSFLAAARQPRTPPKEENNF